MTGVQTCALPILNQEYNIVKAIKNAIVEIEKDNKLKGNLENKD